MKKVKFKSQLWLYRLGSTAAKIKSIKYIEHILVCTSESPQKQYFDIAKKDIIIGTL